jgi:DNA-binding CsgD family transcriptional regulator
LGFEMITLTGVESLSMTAVTALLNTIAVPLLLLQSNRSIMHTNVAGNEMLLGSQELRISKARLAGRAPKETKMLANVLTRVGERQHPETLCLVGDAERPSLVLSIAPVPGTELLAVCVYDFQSTGASLEGFFMRAFGLSAQSAELAEHMMHGLTLIEFSAKTGVAREAARTRLKNLFKRTGCKSQAALVATLWRAKTLAVLHQPPA